MRSLRNNISEVIKPAFQTTFRDFKNIDGRSLFERQSDGSYLLNTEVGEDLLETQNWRKVGNEEYGTIESLELLWKCQGKFGSHGKDLQPERESVNGKAIIKCISNLPATHIAYFEMVVSILLYL